MTPYRIQEIRLSLVRSRRPTFRVSESAEAARAFKNLAKEVRESLYAIYLNAANEVIGFERISTGTIGDATVEPAEVLRTALITGARALILIHNHPSGSISPSASDRMVTMEIARTGKLFKIKLLDHIIIGANGAYYSFSDSNMFQSDEIVPLYTGGKNGRASVSTRRRKG